MARCERCGNDYDKSFQVTMAGKAHTFDSFECAIQCFQIGLRYSYSRWVSQCGDLTSAGPAPVTA